MIVTNLTVRQMERDRQATVVLSKFENLPAALSNRVHKLGVSLGRLRIVFLLLRPRHGRDKQRGDKRAGENALHGQFSPSISLDVLEVISRQVAGWCVRHPGFYQRQRANLTVPDGISAGGRVRPSRMAGDARSIPSLALAAETRQRRGSKLTSLEFGSCCRVPHPPRKVYAPRTWIRHLSTRKS